MKILAISGSLRKASFNTALLRAASALAPAGLELQERLLHGIPLYDEDVHELGYPELVLRFREEIAQADGVLFVTPEYNYSIPGVLKNAIDWASRGKDQPFNGKPVALMSASGGVLGGSRAQYHLRQVLVYLEALTLNKPEVFVGRVSEKFDAELTLTDEATRQAVLAQLTAFSAWIERLRR